MNERIKWLLLFLSLTLFAGCLHQPVSAQDELVPNSVNLLGTSTREQVRIEKHGMMRGVSDLYDVQVVFHNISDKPVQLECRTTFFDSRGVPVEAQSEWKMIFLKPEALGVYQENSTQQRGVAYYYVEAREVR